MDAMVACPDCGTPNRSDADLCAQCWRGMNEDLASRIPVAAFAAATSTPPRTLRPAPPPPVLTPPVQAPIVREAAPGPVPYFAPLPQPPRPVEGIPPAPDVAASDRSEAKTKRFGSGKAKWRWAHLWAVGVSAWGLPEYLTRVWAPRFQGRGIMDAALAIQIGGYVLAALVVALLVSRVNGGDWSTVGIRWSEKAYDDIFRGAGFGLLLIGIFFVGVFAVTGGELEGDALVKLLVGGTSGPGFFLAAIVLVVGAPVIEEIYYRGMLYEKFGRWGRWPAMIGTSILFVVAHGALIIPALILLAFGLAWKRQTKSLWYTMGSHAAWNLVVLCIGVVLMSGPAAAFSPPDGAYTLKHPADWTEAPEATISGPGGGTDLVLMTAAGSMMAVGRTPLAPGVHRGNLKAMLVQATSSMPAPPGMAMNGIQDSDLIGGGLVSAYEMSMAISDPSIGNGKVRMLTVVRDGASEVIMLMVVCVQAECPAAEADFETMAKSFEFSS